MFCKCLTTEADIIVWVNFQYGLLLVRSVFIENKKKLKILRKNEKIVKLPNWLIHLCPCFRLLINKNPAIRTK